MIPSIFRSFSHTSKLSRTSSPSFIRNHSVYIWGKQNFTDGPEEPHIFSKLGSDIAQICTSNKTIFAIKEDGSLWGIGENKHGVLGPNPHSATEFSKLKYPDGLRFKSIACSNNHAAAIDENGQVFTWGYGGSMGKESALGHPGVKKTIISPKLVEFFVEKDEKILQVACGDNHTMFLANGKLYICGSGEYGILGAGGCSSKRVPVLMEYFDGITVKKISAGSNYSMACDDDELYCWGRNDKCQLGVENGMMVDLLNIETYPTSVMEGKFVDISGGSHSFTSAITDSKVFIWGSSLHLYPYEIDFKEKEYKFSKISSGKKFSAVVTTDGELFTFGYSKNNVLAHKSAGKMIFNFPEKVRHFENKKVIDAICSDKFVLALVDEKN